MKRLVALCVDNVNRKVMLFDTLNHEKKWLNFTEIDTIQHRFGANIGNLSVHHDSLLTTSAQCSAQYNGNWIYKLSWYELDNIAVIDNEIYYDTNVISHRGELHGIVKHNNRYYVHKGRAIYCIYKPSELKYADYECIHTAEKVQRYTTFGYGNPDGTVVLNLGTQSYVDYFNNITGLFYRNTEDNSWYVSETGKDNTYTPIHNSIQNIKRNFLMFSPMYFRDIENIVETNLFKFQQIFIQTDRQTIKHILTFIINYDIIEYNKQLCLRLGAYNIKVNVYNKDGKCNLVVKAMASPIDSYEVIGNKMTSIDYPKGEVLQKIRYIA